MVAILNYMVNNIICIINNECQLLAHLDFASKNIV